MKLAQTIWNYIKIAETIWNYMKLAQSIKSVWNYMKLLEAYVELSPQNYLKILDSLILKEKRIKMKNVCKIIFFHLKKHFTY